MRCATACSSFTRRRGYQGPIARFELEPERALLGAAVRQNGPKKLCQALGQYGPGGLSVALVVAVNEDDNSRIDSLRKNGSEDSIPWAGIAWAKPRTSTQKRRGRNPPRPTTCWLPASSIYVMPTDTGFWALANLPVAQSAIVSLDPYDGAITSLSGGFDFALNKFNRVVQAYRQPGSSFKPFIYSAALENGNTPATVVLDAPVVINSSELEAVWRPINYSGRFYGPTRLREALVRSMNLVSVRLLLFETGVGRAVRHIARFGFNDAALPHNGSLALGAGSASPLDMAQGYATLANGGFAVKPYVIDAIYGPENEVLYRAEPVVACADCEAGDPPPRRTRDGSDGGAQTDGARDLPLEALLSYRPDAAEAPELYALINSAPRAVSAQNAYLVTDMMRDVIRRGTGRRAMTLGRSDLSGKTGTSNDRRDAWFGGFNADLASIVWVGYDDDSPLGPGEEGSRTALPVWIDFSRLAYDGVPEHSLPMPEGIVSVKIDRETGCPARAGQTNVSFEVFEVGRVPRCETVEAAPDLYNDADGLGGLFDETDEPSAAPGTGVMDAEQTDIEQPDVEQSGSEEPGGEEEPENEEPLF